MRELPFISVVVPTHGRRELLGRLLQSLFVQDYDKSCYEIRVVHNYSADGTEEAVAEYQEQSPVPLYYSKQFNSTPTPSRQFGACSAKGDLIAFIDDDCIAEPGWLMAGMRAFTLSAQDGGPVGIVQGQTLPNPELRRFFLEKTVEIRASTIFFETCNIFYSKQAFEAVGGFAPEFMDKFYGEDTDLGWRVKKQGYAVKFAEQATVYHYVFPVSIWKWLKEPLFFKNLPYLVKKHPEIRAYMAWRFFLTKESAYFQLLMLAFVLSLVGTSYAMLLSLPYFIARYKSGGKMPSVRARLARIVAGLPRGLFTWYALVWGCCRYRSLLL